MDYLQADGALFVNTQFRIRLDNAGDPEKPGQRCSCDAIAIDLRHGAVYLCETAFENKFGSLIKKLSAWTKNWESIKSTLRVNCRLPANWRIHVWLFVQKDAIEMLDGKLEQFRHINGVKFKIKITALEDVQPWRASAWERCEGAWETDGQRILI